jgi:ABC-type phosphate transport system substrate-binding protein
MRKKIQTELLQEASEQGKTQVGSRLKAIQSRVRSTMTRFIPRQIQWITPILQKNVKIFRPNLGTLKNEENSNQNLQTQGATVTSQDNNSLRPISQPAQSIYSKYACVQGNPLSCEWPQKTTEESPTQKYCLNCQFPTVLPAGTIVKGYRDSYQIEHFLKHRGQGRLYQATQLANRQPVILKEYLLPKLYFNLEETKLRKQMFLQLAGLSLVDSRPQNFRVIFPWEAIADEQEERCYLVTQMSLDAAPTLESYLRENGALSYQQVRQILNQVLQSLECLHGQRFRLPSHAIKTGVAHGNLSLESLLILPNFQGFFIYLCDLALWEHRFFLPGSEPHLPLPVHDLKNLGYLAFYLLAGRKTDVNFGQPLDPKIDDHWPPVPLSLKHFILNLIGVSATPFLTAEIARQNLMKLPPNVEVIKNNANPSVIVEPQKKSRHLRFLGLLIALASLVLLATLLGWLFQRNRALQKIASEGLICCIQQVSNLPLGQFNYTGEKEGSWSYVLQQSNLIEIEETLENKLEEKLQNPDNSENQDTFEVSYQPQPSTQAALNQVIRNQADFAIANLINANQAYQTYFYRDLGYQTFAYDGIVIFVPFSYSRRNNSLPTALNGQISLETLQQLYTGKITNWQELGGPNLPVKLYMPAEKEVVEIFEQQVLKTSRNIQQFRKLIKKPQETDTNFVRLGIPMITPLSTFAMLREVIRDFEDRETGSIAFATLSKVFGQCSVYPLALKTENQPAISPLIHNSGKPITPETDLCDDKGNYQQNSAAFTSQIYPLAYPFVVIYPRDNRREPVGQKFAEILNTIEVQKLLQQTGLVPAQPLNQPCDCQQN